MWKEVELAKVACRADRRQQAGNCTTEQADKNVWRGKVTEHPSRITNMNSLDAMLERNKDFAAQQSAEGTLMP